MQAILFSQLVISQTVFHRFGFHRWGWGGGDKLIIQKVTIRSLVTNTPNEVARGEVSKRLLEYLLLLLIL